MAQKKSAFWRLEKRAQLSQVFAVKKHHENRKIDLCHSIPGLATIFSRCEKILPLKSGKAKNTATMRCDE
jgi:hypothetical protein